MIVESVFVAIILILTIVYLFLLNVFSYWKKRKIPHEKPIFFFGNAKGFNKTKNFADLTKPLYDKFKGQGPFCGLYLFIRPIVLPTDLDLIKNILIKDFNYFTDRGLFYNEKDDPLSAHLFLLDGAQWRKMRTNLTPTFTSGKIKFMYPMVLQVAQEFEKVLKEDVQIVADLEMREYLARFTTDVIGTCAFGIECNSLKNPNVEFRGYGRRFLQEQRLGALTRTFAEVFPNLAKCLKVKILYDDISNFFLNIVKETVNYREMNGAKRNDFIDLLLEIKNNKEEADQLTVEQMAAQAFLFFVAGFETSSTTMSYCLYELAKNQDIQNKMRNEISTVLKKHNGEFTYEAMKDMNFIEQVINETLRMYPVVSVLVRKAIKKYSVPNTNLCIEKGTGVFIPVYAIHHDPEIYQNPEIFDPQRFSPAECQDRHQCAFLPFGDGPRNCIGLRFGKMQAHVGLVTLLRNFKFSPCSATQIPLEFVKEGFIFAPKGGIHLKVERL